MALRFIPFVLVLTAVQVGLWSALSTLFFPRPDQARSRRGLAVALGALALFFLGFMMASRAGLQLPELLRMFAVEPLLAVQILLVPLMILLGIGLSAAGRIPPSAGGDELSEPRRIFLARAATGLIGATGVAVIA